MRYVPINPSALIPLQGQLRIALPQVPGYEYVGEVIAPVIHRLTGWCTLAVMHQKSKPSTWLKPNWK
ncbi:hypothetical protein D4100_05045 [Serratia inhibens]|uniref:Uncharacterized protein n=1 Tax=Serratia inhibens TaxID=2338073 RepID=A0AA92X913_9GAMM|nr:hypothetical protein D4100_05045 [Serratia inhibens]